NPKSLSETEILSARDVETLVLTLHSDVAETYQDEAAAKKVKLWAQQDDVAKHDERWRDLLASLAGAGGKHDCRDIQAGLTGQ
ncbi:MAG: hypothetical protein AAAB19_24685, partial [Rhizobium sp.]